MVAELPKGLVEANSPSVPRLPLRDVFRYPHFPVVVALLMVAQFLDRGLALLIPLQVARMVELDRVAVISGAIISVAAVTATLSTNLVARLAHDVPSARLLTLGLLVLSEPIVKMLFEHGAFSAADTRATARALMWLSLGLPAHVLFKAFAPAFFARENTTAPLAAVLKGVLLATAGAFLFGHLFGPEGIAAAIALGAWSSALSLLREGTATFGFSLDAAARKRLPRIAAAALAMGGLLWLATRFLPIANLRGLAQAAILLALIAGGIALYGLILGLFGVTDWREAVNAVRSSQPRGLRD